MKFLFDTNLLIRLEPTSAADVEPGTPAAIELLRMVHAGKHQAFVHPGSLRELAGDKQKERRDLRAILVQKYTELPAPPETGKAITDVLGTPRIDSHDVVDFALLAAVQADAIDFLVSDDQRLLRRAARLRLEPRVLSPGDALATLRAWAPTEPQPLPALDFVYAHQLDGEDPIFASLRDDYDGFDGWLAKCKREQRRAFRILAGGRVAALAIIKPEPDPEYDLDGPLLKVCTFKVSANHRGFRYGELLLKAVFDYAFRNRLRSIYVTVYDKHEELVALFESFGFRALQAQTKVGEAIMAKCLVPAPKDWEQLDGLEFHIQFGPRHLKVSSPVVIPIRDAYHEKLFPELQVQQALFQGTEVFGNSILKAYLCRASSRQVQRGTTVLFYHSGGAKRVDALGVVEDVLVSSQPAVIARFVGKRTVYTIDEITAMCEKGEVVAILFRQATSPEQPLYLRDLMLQDVLTCHPQSIVAVGSKGLEWLRSQLEERL